MSELSQGATTLAGRRLTLRAGDEADARRLLTILQQPSVSRWWGTPDPLGEIIAALASTGDEVLFVIEAEGEVAGGIQYCEEPTAGYRHAGIDIYLGSAHQGRGLGREAVAVLARYLFEVRGHHRLTIDPAVTNVVAIRCYESVGFRRVGVMRQYERGGDGTFHDGLLMDMLREELSAHTAADEPLT